MTCTKLYQTDSIGIFKIFWLTWRFFGVDGFRSKYKSFLHNALLNIFITIWYPTHLTLGLLMLATQDEIFKNLSIAITCAVCSFKHYCLRWHLGELHEVETLLDQLDRRVQSHDEFSYFTQGPKRSAQFIAKLFFAIYMGTNVAGILTVLLNSEIRLMYPAWFPFDWQSSSALYWTALVYQIVGVSVQIVQNIANDVIAPVVLCVLGGHVHLLAMRVSRIGYDPKRTLDENVDELKMCVEDHIILIRLFKLVQNSLSLVQLMLFISSGLNVCVTLVYLIFFVDSFVGTLYYSIFITALAVELFPCYYFGSVLQQEFEGLTYAIFRSNWPEQPKRYRKNMIIFVSNTLRKVTMVGGGIVSIQLESFFAICKMAYSLFTLVRSIK